MIPRWTSQLLYFFIIMIVTSAFAQNNLSDTSINSMVQSKLASDTTVSDLNINVVTRQQEVSLIGTVDTEKQASTLIQLAASTPGVKDVNAAQLIVKNSTQPFTDLFITAKVEGQFIRAQLLSKQNPPPLSIQVETKNGVVYLTGKADNSAQIDNANKLAQAVSGVIKVDSKIYIVKHK